MDCWLVGKQNLVFWCDFVIFYSPEPARVGERCACVAHGRCTGSYFQTSINMSTKPTPTATYVLSFLCIEINLARVRLWLCEQLLLPTWLTFLKSRPGSCKCRVDVFLSSIVFYLCSSSVLWWSGRGTLGVIFRWSFAYTRSLRFSRILRRRRRTRRSNLSLSTVSDANFRVTHLALKAARKVATCTHRLWW